MVGGHDPGHLRPVRQQALCSPGDSGDGCRAAMDENGIGDGALVLFLGIHPDTGSIRHFAFFLPFINTELFRLLADT